MSKVIEWAVICPDCGHKQAYHSHRKDVEGKRRKTCNRCGRSFKAKEQRLANLGQVRKRMHEEKKEKGEGFHKYRKKD